MPSQIKMLFQGKFGATRIEYAQTSQQAKDIQKRLFSSEGWVLKSSVPANSQFEKGFQRKIAESQTSSFVERGKPKEEVYTITTPQGSTSMSKAVAEKLKPYIKRQEFEAKREEQIKKLIITPRPEPEVPQSYLVVEPADISGKFKGVSTTTTKTTTVPILTSGITTVTTTKPLKTTVKTTVKSPEQISQELWVKDVEKQYETMSATQKIGSHVHTLLSPKGFEYLGAAVSPTPTKQIVMEQLAITGIEKEGLTTSQLFLKGAKESLSSPPVMIETSYLTGVGLGMAGTTALGGKVLASPVVKAGMYGIGAYSGYDIYKDVKMGKTDLAIGKAMTLGASMVVGYKGFQEGQRIMQKPTLPSGEFDIKRIDVDEAIVEKKILGENVGKRQMTVEFIESEPKPISTKDMFGGKYEEMAMGVGEEKITMMGETGKFRMKEVSSSKIKDKLFPDDFWTDPKLVTDFDITPQTPRTIPLTEIQLSGKTIPPEYHTFGLTNKPKTTGLMARESFLFDAGVSLKDLSGVSGSGILGTGVKSDLPSFFSKVVIDPKTKIMIVPGVPGVFKRQTILQDLSDVYSGKYEEKPSIGITGKVTKVAGKKEELSPVSVKIKPSSKPLSKLSTSFTSEKTSGLQSTTKFPDTSLAFPTETEKNPLFQKPKKSDYIWTEDYEHIVTPPGYPSSSQMPAQSTVTLMSSKTNLTLKPLLKTTTPTIKTSLPSFKEVFKPEAVSKVESIFKTKKTVKKKEGIKQLTTQMPKQIEMSVTSFKSSLKPIEKTFQIRKQMPSLKQRQRLSFKTPLPPNIPSLKIPSIPFSHPSRISLTRPSRKRKVSRRKKSMLDMDIIPSADWLSLTMTEAKKRGKGHHPYPSPKIQKMFRKNIFASSMRFPTAEMLRGKGRLKL